MLEETQTGQARQCKFCDRTCAASDHMFEVTMHKPTVLRWPAGVHLSRDTCAAKTEWERRGPSDRSRPVAMALGDSESGSRNLKGWWHGGE